MADEPVRTKSAKDQIVPIQTQTALAVNDDEVIFVKDRPKVEPELTDKLWQVSNSEGQSGKVQAKTKSSAKYAFMKARGIIDSRQTWTVKEL